jgi:hypothetical protein
MNSAVFARRTRLGGWPDVTLAGRSFWSDGLESVYFSNKQCSIPAPPQGLSVVLDVGRSPSLTGGTEGVWRRKVAFGDFQSVKRGAAEVEPRCSALVNQGEYSLLSNVDCACELSPPFNAHQ